MIPILAIAAIFILRDINKRGMKPDDKHRSDRQGRPDP